MSRAERAFHELQLKLGSPRRIPRDPSHLRDRVQPAHRAYVCQTGCVPLFFSQATSADWKSFKEFCHTSFTQIQQYISNHKSSRWPSSIFSLILVFFFLFHHFLYCFISLNLSVVLLLNVGVIVHCVAYINFQKDASRIACFWKLGKLN